MLVPITLYSSPDRCNNCVCMCVCSAIEGKDNCFLVYRVHYFCNCKNIKSFVFSQMLFYLMSQYILYQSYYIYPFNNLWKQDIFVFRIELFLTEYKTVLYKTQKCQQYTAVWAVWLKQIYVAHMILLHD